MRRRGSPVGSSSRTLPLSVRSLFELGRQLGRRAGLDQHLVHALEALVLSGREALSDQVSELG